MAIVINGVGSYIPEKLMRNSDFLSHDFRNKDGSPIPGDNDLVIKKFESITGIVERRYLKNELSTSDMATIAAQRAIDKAGIDPETLDYIIFAHNFGDVKYGSTQSDTVPSLASRVKFNLKIKKPSCVAYDMLFGCPGWLESVIQAQAFIKAKMAKRCLVIGSESLSRVIDLHDRDSMIFSDGAGAVIIEEAEGDHGILAFESASYASQEAFYLNFQSSYNKSVSQETRYMKMNGHKIYTFALMHVPNAMKSCLEKSGISIDEVSKLFIHQANEKMDIAICERFYKLFDKEVPEHILPMSIQKLGNSSVATLPTLLDLVETGQIEHQEVKKGDVIIFASVGAGMNINAMVYRY